MALSRVSARGCSVPLLGNLEIPFVLVFALVALVGCGASNSSSGGGTTASPVTQGSPQGVYTGTTSTGETFETIVLPNSTFYALYGSTSGNVFTVDGMLTGQGKYNNGTFTVTTVNDYYYTGVIYTGTVNATYVVGSSLSGTVSEVGNASVTFSGTPIPGSQFTFGTPALLSNITGTWSGYLFGNLASQVTIAASGTFAGTTQGCAFSGTITPDPSGSNFFDFTLQYGGSPCVMPNQTQTGVAVDYLLSDAVTHQLLAGVSSVSSGNVFIANRTPTPAPSPTPTPSAVNDWTWISGSSITGLNNAGVSGLYGTQGVSAASNVPSSRSGAVSWTDSSGDLWLFGGSETGAGTVGILNDLWEFNPSTNEWTWVSGSSTSGAASVYGTKGVAAASNVPGARFNAVSWIDTSGNLWLFGGNGQSATISELNDSGSSILATKSGHG